jgi:hypothetical protein
MLRKLFVVPALSLLLLPALANANFQEGDWELTLSGSAFNGNDFDGMAINVNFSLGHFLTEAVSVGVRQGLGYSDLGGSGDWTGSTRVFGDLHFDMGEWRPFIGASLGYLYGDGVNDTWLYGPEAGVKWFMNSTTFIFAMVEYQVLCSSDDFFKDGIFQYSLGLGVRF